MDQLSTPTRVVALGVNVAFVYIGIKKGGWWHILTAMGLFAGLYNINALTTAKKA